MRRVLFKSFFCLFFSCFLTISLFGQVCGDPGLSLSTPGLQSPANAANLSSSPTTFVFYNNAPTATKYRIQISNNISTWISGLCGYNCSDVTNSEVVVNQSGTISGGSGIVEVTISTTLSPGTYYWTVRVGNSVNQSCYDSNFKWFTVLDDGTGCSYSISPISKNFTTAGGNGSITVTAGSGCNWTASESATWITLNTSSGSGNGTCSYSVTANTGAARNATITIAGKSFSVTQDGTGGSAPNAPTGVTATALSSSEIELTWNSSIGADYYKVYNSGGTLLSDLVYGTSETFTGLQSETQYCYKVKACNDAGDCSGYSSTDCATTGTNCVTIEDLKTCDNQSLFPAAESCTPNLRFGNAFSIGGNHIMGSGSIYLNNYKGNQLNLWPGGNYTLIVNGNSFTTLSAIVLNSFFDFAGTNIRFDGVEVMCDGINVQGNITLPKLQFGKSTAFSAGLTNLYLTTTGLDFAGYLNASGIGVTGFKLDNISVSYNSFDKSLDGSLKISTLLFGVGGEVGITGGRLNRIGFNVSGMHIPLGASGMQITEGHGLVNNLTNPKNLEIGMGLKVAPVALDALADVDISSKFRLGDSFEATGSLNLVKQEIASVGFNVGKQKFGFNVNINYISIVKGWGGFTVSKLPSDKVKLQALFGASVCYPDPDEINADYIVKEGIRYLMNYYDLPIGGVIASCSNYFANMHNSTIKASLSGYLALPFKVLGISKLSYSLDWLGLFNFDRNFGTNFNALGTEARQELGVKSNETYYDFTVNNFEERVLIHAKDITFPEISIILPSGDTVTNSNINSFDNIDYYVIDMNNIVYAIETPYFGDYSIKALNADSIKVYGVVSNPLVRFSNITNNTGSKSIEIDIESSSPCDSATIMIGYTTDKDALDGVVIFEDMPISHGENTFTWDYSTAETGDYYFYALIRNSKGMFSAVFSDQKYKVVNASAPNAPSNLMVSGTASTVHLQWTPNNSAANYLVYYSNKPGGLNFSSNNILVGDTNQFDLTNLIPGRYYEFMVVAFNDSLNKSDASNTASITWNSAVENNQPFIPAQQIPKLAYTNQLYQYTLTAIDSDNDQLTFQIAEGPAGLTISNTGYISWTPLSDQIGVNFVKLYVRDIYNATDSVMFTIDVYDNYTAAAWVEFDKTVHHNYDEYAAVTISNPDLNLSYDLKDNIPVRIYSNSDMTGIIINAQETSANSRMFNTNFNFSQTASSGKSIKVAYGDTVWVEYHDLYPDSLIIEHAYFVEFKADFDFCGCTGESVIFKNKSIGSGVKYQWSFGDGQTSTERHPEVVYSDYGFYTVTLSISSSTGDYSSITKTIFFAPELRVENMNVDNVSCFGSADGSIEAEVSGGKLPFTYSWSTLPAQTGQTAVNLGPGTYSVTVTDFNGCQVIGSATVTEPAPLVASLGSYSDVICNGADNGFISVSPSGGTPPYFYTWNSTPVQSSISAIMLGAGSYTVTVTDNNGCATTMTHAITEPTAILAEINSVTQPSCFGFNDGNASVSVTGGLPPYSFTWNTVPVQQVATATDLHGGNYIVTVTDNNNCTVEKSVFINQPAELYSSLEVINASCYGYDDGKIIVSTTGGTVPYYYSWNNGQTNNIATQLITGNYDVIIEDKNGCADTLNAVVAQPDELIVTGKYDTLMCKGSEYQLNLQVSGGTIPYSYLWWCSASDCSMNASGISNPVVRPSHSTEYYVQVTDDNNCFSNIDTTFVELMPEIILEIERDTAIFEGESVQLIATSNLPVSYQWLPESWLDNPFTADPVAIPTETVLYELTATDSLGCKATHSVEIIVYRNLIIPNAFTPNDDGYNDVWEIKNIEDYPECVVEIYDRFGTLLFTSKGYVQAWDGTTAGKDLPVGSYFYVIDIQMYKEVIKGTVSIIK